MGFPAILKGFVDKVFIPGVSFNLNENGDYVPCLHNIKRLGVACTYGGSRLRTFLAGDPAARFITRSLRMPARPARAATMSRSRHEPPPRRPSRRLSARCDAALMANGAYRRNLCC